MSRVFLPLNFPLLLVEYDTDNIQCNSVLIASDDAPIRDQQVMAIGMSKPIITAPDSRFCRIWIAGSRGSMISEVLHHACNILEMYVIDPPLAIYFGVVHLFGCITGQILYRSAPSDGRFRGRSTIMKIVLYC